MVASSKKKVLLLVWHSRTGAAKQMAQAASHGALSVVRELQAQDMLDIVMKAADDTDAADLLDADGYLFCAPENLAALSGAMKEFFDRNYYPVLDRLNGRPYALMIAAGSDRSEEHTSELQSLMSISYAAFCLQKKTHTYIPH